MMRIIFCIFIGQLCMIGGVRAQKQLADYLAVAKQNSPLLREQQNLIQSGALEIQLLRDQLTRPQIGMTGAYLFAPVISADNDRVRLQLNSKGADNYYGQSLAATNGGVFQALAGVTQPLYNGARLRIFSAQVDINTQIARNNFTLTGRDLDKVVTDQYLLCLSDARQAELTDLTLQLLAEQFSIVQRLAQAGLMKQSDRALLDIEYHNAEAQKVAFRADYRRDLLDLNLLCGIRDTVIVTLEPLRLMLGADQPEANSLFLEKYRLDSLGLLAAKEAFDTRYKPIVSVFGNYGLNATYLPDIYKRLGLTAGVSVNWMLYDGNQSSIMRQKSQLLQQTNMAYRDFFLNQNAARKNRILAEIQANDARIDLATRQLADYERLIEVYKKELLNSQITIIQFINVLKDRALVQRDAERLQTNRLLLINAYDYWNW
jgi:outer membrane protein TolC